MNWEKAGYDVGWGLRWECFYIAGYGLVCLALLAFLALCAYFILADIASRLRARFKKFMYELINDGSYERTERHLRGLDEETKCEAATKGQGHK